MTPEQILEVKRSVEFEDFKYVCLYRETLKCLLDHIAKLEAGRDAVLEEAAKLCDERASEWISQHSAFMAAACCAEEIRALKSAPLTDDQRHEAVAKILKDTP